MHSSILYEWYMKAFLTVGFFAPPLCTYRSRFINGSSASATRFLCRRSSIPFSPPLIVIIIIAQCLLLPFFLLSRLTPFGPPSLLTNLFPLSSPPPQAFRPPPEKNCFLDPCFLLSLLLLPPPAYQDCLLSRGGRPLASVVSCSGGGEGGDDR